MQQQKVGSRERKTETKNLSSVQTQGWYAKYLLLEFLFLRQLSQAPRFSVRVFFQKHLPWGQG